MTSAIIGLIGVVIGSALTILKDVLMSSGQRRSHAEYAAIRIVCILDEYLDKCVGVVLDDGTAYGQPAGRTNQGEEFLSPQVKLPSPPDYPNDIDWKSVRTRLMYRALALPNRARETDQYIAGCAEHAFPPDYEELFEARHEGYAKLGLEAHQLAGEMRTAYRIAPRDDKTWNPHWNPVGRLEKRLEEIQSKRSSQADTLDHLHSTISGETGEAS